MSLPLAPNPQTGFLESNKITSFDSDKKVKFIELANECAKQGNYPGVFELCEAVQISPWTFYKHMRIDERFKEAWTLALRRVEDLLVKTMVARGKTPGGYLDRITWLRKHFPEWNPQANVQFNHNNTGNKKVIDAVLVDSTPEIRDDLGIFSSESKPINPPDEK